MENQSNSDNKVVNVYNLHPAKFVPQGDVCRQGKKWENQLSSDTKEVTECVQTYNLHRLCHRVMFAGKE